MISYEEALSIISANAPRLGEESVSLEELTGRVLFRDVCAPFDLPLFDNSAVDGFGVIITDVNEATDKSPRHLSLMGVLRAGDSGEVALGQGSSLKILTGGVVPAGVDAVVMREYCHETEGSVAVGRSAVLGENIRRRGAEYKQGQMILPAGMRVTPPVVGMIASLGLSAVPVYKQPSVAVISTGNELVSPGMPLNPGQIYNSNSYALAAALREFGVSQVRHYHAPEDRRQTEEILHEALSAADLVVSAGGVSVGDFDFVTEACQTVGVQKLIWRISIKPGKPVYFGVRSRSLVGAAGDGVDTPAQLVFGLPGNPVSALVTLHLFVRPAIYKMMGMDLDASGPTKMPATLAADLRKRPDRMEFVRAVLDSDGTRLIATPTSGQDSHMLGGLCNANCLIHFPKDRERLQAGEQVIVEILRWGI